MTHLARAVEATKPSHQRTDLEAVAEDYHAIAAAMDYAQHFYGDELARMFRDIRLSAQRAERALR